MEDYLKAFLALYALALAITVANRFKANSRRRTVWFANEMEKRSYDEPPDPLPSPPRHPNLFVAALPNLILLIGVLIALPWAMGQTIEGPEPLQDRGFQSVIVGVGFALLLVVVARWVIKTFLGRS